MSKFDILCLTETKIKTDFQLEGFKCISLNHDVVKYHYPGIHGINIFVSINIMSIVDELVDNMLFDSALWVKVNNQFILCSVYMPHEASKYHYVECFDDLATDISTVMSKYELPLVIVGDFNSRSGTLDDFVNICDTDKNNFAILNDNYTSKDYLDSLDIPSKRFSVDKVINNNGRKFIDLCQCFDLKIVNGRMGADKYIGNATCDDASVIDYAICSPAIFADIHDFYIDIFDPLLSDKHNPMIINVALKHETVHELPVMYDNTINASPKSMIFRWNYERKDDYLKEFDLQNIENLKNKVEHLSIITQSEIDVISDELKNVFLQPAKNTNMCKVMTTSTMKPKKRNDKYWFNEECRESKRQYTQYKKSVKHFPAKERKEALKEHAKRHKKVIRRVKRTHDRDLHEQLRLLKNKNPKDYWNLINTDNTSNTIGNVSIEEFQQHFEELGTQNLTVESLCREDIRILDQHLPNDIDNENLNSEFTIEEVTAHVKKLKNNKSPGIDNILNEFIKCCPAQLMLTIVSFFNLILNHSIIPTDWTIGIIKPLYKKKGDINNVDNYRGITLLSCLGKLFTSLLNTRIYDYMCKTKSLGEEQAGFRKDYNTMDHIFALHVLTHYYISQKRKLFCAFIDYKKAFDLVDRSFLWTKLLASNIKGKVFDVIQALYNNTKSCVRVGNSDSSFFHCKVGVRQGENLSPLLFSIYLNDFQNYISNNFTGLPFLSNNVIDFSDINMYFNLYCLLYADDTIVFAENDVQLQLALDAVFYYCNKWALQVNTSKSKVMIFSKGKVRKYKTFNFGNNTIDVVDDYVYLGTTFNYNGQFHKAKNKQMIQAKKSTFSLLSKIIKLNLPVDISLDLYDKLVMPILLYGSEVWGFGNINQVKVTYNTFLKRILKLNKSTSTCMLYSELGVRNPMDIVDNRLVNFWYSIVNGNSSKISNILYKFVKTMHDLNIYKLPWLEKVKELLDLNGMSNVFYDVSNVNGNWLKNAFKLRSTDIYRQNLSEDVSNNAACINYRILTVDVKLQRYLCVLPKQWSILICKFKCGNHKLPVVTGRYANIALEHRMCMLCDNNDIGDEIHYLFYCNFFINSRKRYLKKYYYTNVNIMKIGELFDCSNSSTLLNLAKFIKEIYCFFQSNH